MSETDEKHPVQLPKHPPPPPVPKTPPAAPLHEIRHDHDAQKSPVKKKPK